MKIQLLFGVVFAVLLMSVRAEDEEDNSSDWSSEEEECVNSLKLDKDHIASIKKEDIVPENNTDFNNYLSCYWKKVEAQDEDGEINYTKVYEEFLTEFRKLFGKEPDVSGIIIGGMIRTAINECSEIKIEGETHGETVAKVQNCIIKKMMKAMEDAPEDR